MNCNSQLHQGLCLLALMAPGDPAVVPDAPCFLQQNQNAQPQRCKESKLLQGHRALPRQLHLRSGRRPCLHNLSMYKEPSQPGGIYSASAFPIPRR